MKEKLTARQKRIFLRLRYLKWDGIIWLFCFYLATLIQVIETANQNSVYVSSEKLSKLSKWRIFEMRPSIKLVLYCFRNFEVDWHSGKEDALGLIKERKCIQIFGWYQIIPLENRPKYAQFFVSQKSDLLENVYNQFSASFFCKISLLKLIAKLAFCKRFMMEATTWKLQQYGNISTPLCAIGQNFVILKKLNFSRSYDVFTRHKKAGKFRIPLCAQSNILFSYLTFFYAKSATMWCIGNLLASFCHFCLSAPLTLFK